MVYPDNLGDLQVEGMNLALEDGAQWNVTNPDLTVSAPEGTVAPVAAFQNINTLALNEGVINMDAENAPESVAVDMLEGTGGTINARAAVQEDGTIKSTTLTVAKVDATAAAPALAVNYTGITSDDLTAENTQTLKALL